MVRAKVEPILNEYNQNTLLEQHGLITKAEKDRLLDKYFKYEGKGRYEKVQASAKPSFNPHLNTSSIMILKWIEEQSNAGFSLKHLIEKHILDNKGEIIDISKSVIKMDAEDFDKKLIEVIRDEELQTPFVEYEANEKENNSNVVHEVQGNNVSINSELKLTSTVSEEPKPTPTVNEEPKPTPTVNEEPKPTPTVKLSERKSSSSNTTEKSESAGQVSRISSRRKRITSNDGQVVEKETIKNQNPTIEKKTPESTKAETTSTPKKKRSIPKRFL